jgi:hypothetical protein
MLKWFGGSKPDHPMNNVKAAEKLLTELDTGDPEQALEEVCAYIDSVSHAGDFKPDLRGSILLLLDDFGHRLQDRLIAQYLGAARIHDLKSRERCQKAYDFWAALSAAYIDCLVNDFELEKGKALSNADLVAQLLGCGLRAVGSQERVRHLTYQAIDKEVWIRLCRLYRIAERSGLAPRGVRMAKSDLHNATASQEFLRPLMLEVGAPESLAPEHVELAARTVAQLAALFGIGRSPAAVLPFYIDLANPARPALCGDTPPQGETIRYFGPGDAISALDELLRADDPTRITSERRPGEEFSPWDRATVLKHLKRYWGKDRPSRRTGRTRAQGDLSVLNSLDAIRTVAAQIGTNEMETITETAAERKQELRLVPENVDLTPETWIEKDSSADGVGAEVPPSARGKWVKIGRLCALKGANYANWWVGVIRRLDAPGSAKVHAGIQVLTKTPYSLWLKKVGMQGALSSSWATSSGSMRYDYVDAVLLVPESEAVSQDPVLVMRPQDYKPELVCEALLGDKPRLIKFGRAIENGEDYMIVGCKWTS